MRVLICILLGVLPAFAFPTPEAGVPPECIDPTFACQDLQSARLCRVVKTCIYDVWETMSVPDSNDEICDICKEMVKEARDQLLSNMTQEEIKEVFEGSCKLLPVKLIADACIKVVDEIIPQLVEMLASRMDPTMVCTVSGMCFPSKNDLEVEKHILKFVRDYLLRQKNDQCAECTQMMTDVQTFMKSSSEAEVKSYVEKLCHEKMPSYLCNIVLNTYFNDIYNFILNTEPAKMCSSVGICPQKCELNNEVSKVEDELTCEFCEHLLQHVKDLITSNTTLDEFKTALLNFCKKTGKWADKCTNLVNDYYDMIFTYIKQLDTRGMCTLMGLCDKTGCVDLPLIKIDPEREAHRKIPLIRLQPAQYPSTNLKPQPLVRLIPAEMISKKQMKESNDVFQLPLDRLMHPLPVFEKDTECALCKAFSFYLEKDLAGDNSKIHVRQAINGICEKWMVEYPDHCKYLVNNYSQKMQMAIAKGVSFDNLCSEVKACLLEKNKKDDLNVKVIPKSGENPFCDLCKDAMNEVEKALSDPAIKQKLRNSLDQVCNLLPKSFRDDCVSFINQNIDALIDILEQELQPDQICPALKLCGSQKAIGVPPRVNDLECDVCMDVVSSFRTKLQDPASKEIVLTFLEEGCMRLPDSVAGECKKFVDDNIDYVMKVIVEGLDPKKVCSILNICPAAFHIEQPKGMINDIECDLCKQVIGKVEDMIKDQKTEDEIKAALDKVCSYLPSSLSAKCEQFVNQYTDLIVTLLMEELDPQLVCARLGLCPTQIKEEKPKELKDLECDLCKDVVAKVEEIMKNNKTEDEIKNALDKVCSYLPSSLATKCEQFVNQYTELLIDLISQNLSPDLVCAAVEICPVADVECEGCQYALHFIQNILMSNETKGKVKEYVKRLCSVFLPQTLAGNCEAFIDEYGDSLLILVAQEIDPSSMCYKAGLCKSNAIIPQLVADVAFPNLNHFQIDECSVCTTVVDYVDKLLEEDDVDKEITHLVEKVCVVLPTSFRDKCSSMLETYGPYILQMIGQVANSKQLCQEIDLCPRQAGQVHLIGGAKCTFGPSYWCHSPAHAAACKAESYCRSKVWVN
ncbi:uncharacterized protein LOC129981935 isoform X2 [Argiope bruennichi]|uniref:uncharacterized protein LOC129981935 isoform X2 n=1 Tax=Argiope bruennichi TaxID=94029 RepID=UPI00249497B4|nr:uncharacterized protein LOC129981935 isoform X2 [Argiope bruennichi]